MKRLFAPKPENDPEFDDRERLLVLTFLRRYVAYCASSGRYAQMNGAAQLFAAADLVQPPRLRHRVIEAG